VIETAGPKLEVVQQASGRWGWRYVDRSREHELTGNDTFSSEQEAIHSASAAYPDIDDISVESPHIDDKAPGVDRPADALRLALALGATLTAALVLRALRRR
jgi:hypothetical protein